MKDKTLSENSNLYDTPNDVLIDKTKKVSNKPSSQYLTQDGKKSQTIKIPITDNQQASASIGMFDRRINRIGFLLGFIYAIAPFILAIILELSIRTTNLSTSLYATVINIIALLLGFISFILLIPITISLYMRRLHDINRSGGYTFLLLIPLMAQLLFLFLLFKAGNKHNNKFGMPIHSNNYLVVLGFKKPKN